MDELRKKIKEEELASNKYTNDLDKLTQDIIHQKLSMGQLTQALRESELKISEKNQTLDDMAKTLHANELAKKKLEQKVLELKSSLKSVQALNMTKIQKLGI